MPKRPQDLDTHITDIHQTIPPARLTTRLKGGTSKTECIAPPSLPAACPRPHSHSPLHSLYPTRSLFCPLNASPMPLFHFTPAPATALIKDFISHLLYCQVRNLVLVPVSISQIYSTRLPWSSNTNVIPLLQSLLWLPVMDYDFPTSVP